MVSEKTRASPVDCKEIQPVHRKGGSVLGVHWKDWCWSWNSSTLASSCEELTHWKRPWCWERSGAGGEGDDRGWDGWMASSTQWTWVWVNSGSWWWTGRPGVLWFMGSQRVWHDWTTELNWKAYRLTSRWKDTYIMVWEGSESRSFCLYGVIVYHSPSVEMRSPSGSTLNPTLLGFYGSILM